MPKKKSPDPAHIETDKIIERIERRLAREYAQANAEVEEKLADYLRRFELKDEKWREWVRNGKKTKEEYKQWRTGQILMGKRWEKMKDALADDYVNASKIARSITEGYMPEVYALNHNYGTFEVERGSMLDTSYTLYNREAVERILRDNPKLYGNPGKDVLQKIASGELKRWEKKQIQSVMLQGILQGESIPKLTKRLERVTAGDHKAAIRNARTMATGVQNAGRLDAYKRANKLGIPTKKQWLATLDSRTRHAHRQLDGVIKGINEPFENEFGEIMYPCDPEAEAANVYNCRCRLNADVDGEMIDYSDLSLRNVRKLGDMSYEEWKEKHGVSQPITAQERKSAAIRAKYIKEYREK